MTQRAYALLMLFALTAGSTLLGASQPAHALRCEAQINGALDAASIQQSDVKSIKVARREAGRRSSSNYTYDAWIRMNSCSGYVMVSMTRMCVVQQTYTTGDCSRPDMPNF